MAPSFLIFGDQLLVAAGNWIFWMVISRIASISEIGNATTIFSLLLFSSTVAQLGLEYPLLKRTLTAKGSTFTSAIVIELLITISLIPIVIYSLNIIYGQISTDLIWLTICILLSSSVSFVAKYTLLGVYGAKEILIIDIAGTIVKFVAGYTAVTLGYGTNGILFAFLAQFFLMMLISFPIVKAKLGSTVYKISRTKEILKDSVINTPAKFSRTLLFSLSVVLLASFGISESEIGVFYIVMMISLVAGGLVSGISYMVLPPSSSQADLSSNSLRIGLSLTVPLIVALVSAPDSILSLLGTQYIEGSTSLIILSIGIVPASVVMMSISRCNSNGDNRTLLAIGISEIIIFLISFVILVPIYGIVGCSISMLLTFLGTSVQSIKVLGGSAMRLTLNALLAIGTGWAVNISLTHLTDINVFISTSISIVISVFILIKLRSITSSEIYRFATSVLARK